MERPLLSRLQGDVFKTHHLDQGQFTAKQDKRLLGMLVDKLSWASLKFSSLVLLSKTLW